MKYGTNVNIWFEFGPMIYGCKTMEHKVYKMKAKMKENELESLEKKLKHKQLRRN